MITNQKRSVQFILDEASMLGSMPAIDDALGMGRAFGVRMQLYYQSVGQLKKCFPEGQEQTLFSNTTQIFFGVNDNATAEYVSNRLGEETIIVESGGTSRSQSSQSSWGQSPSESSGYSTSINENWQQQARKLLKPEEVIALPARTAITFTPGVPPVCTWLLRHYEEKSLATLAKGQASRSTTVWRFVRASFASVLAFGFAAGLTSAGMQAANRPAPRPMSRPPQSIPQHPTFGGTHVGNR